jgi:hypothetical protein
VAKAPCKIRIEELGGPVTVEVFDLIEAKRRRPRGY